MIELDFEKTLNGASGELLLKVNQQITPGRFVTLYGKSGAGKTSLLRILAGLMQADKGLIKVNGSTWLDSANEFNLKPQKRKVGFVFQDYALFPNMTVKENLLFASDNGKDKALIRDLIDIVELGELQHRKPGTLSGGQKQRVALARALVQQPEILMLDEPLSALDHEMRLKLQQYILQVHREYNLTTILISHDVSEILKTSDTMLVLEHGKIIQKGTPAEVFSHKEVSGKFQFVGEIIKMEKQDVIYILSILIGNELVKVVADEREVKKYTIGERVIVASKAFNPIIKKLHTSSSL
ncbi:MAG: ATP-binding cassette domain-containing protein [Marinilabiliaceae bacterium]|nr:ATP-binding cassette domain-containing protein [Marinilabiliaceae bacterium]